MRKKRRKKEKETKCTHNCEFLRCTLRWLACTPTSICARMQYFASIQNRIFCQYSGWDTLPVFSTVYFASIQYGIRLPVSRLGYVCRYPVCEHFSPTCVSNERWMLSCLYFLQNQPWCHHEPLLNPPLSESITPGLSLILGQPLLASHWAPASSFAWIYSPKPHFNDPPRLVLLK
jgi:hypothetical protein